MIFGTILGTLSIGLMKCGRAKCKEAEATRKYFNIVMTRQDKNISKLFKVKQDKFRIDSGRTKIQAGKDRQYSLWL